MDSTYEFSPAQARSSVSYDHVSLLFSWAGTVRAVALHEGERIVVGRSEPSSFVVDDRSLSRAHASFSLQDGRLTVRDLDSTNGTWVNGSRVQEAELLEDDTALLGGVEVRASGRALLRETPCSLSHSAFLVCVSDELQRARLFGRSLSVVALRSGALELNRAATVFALRPVDRLCRFAPSLWLILLAESSARDVESWFEKIKGGGGAPLTAGAASYPDLVCASAELVSNALEALSAASRGELKICQRAAVEDNASPIVVSACMTRLYERVERAAQTSLPVLVLGETGCGKELVAQALHQRGPRAAAPFKAINCATIPGTLIESALFGHERGAFTGADRQTQGLFEQAQGGTVLLDEVGELTQQAQAALLRVLEHQCIVRVGGARELSIDVRVIAATHRDLAAMVAAGTFREDLLYRLDALTLNVPPLRERPEEIAPLVERFLQRARDRWGGRPRGLAPAALQALQRYSWPGNVRQLRNVIECAHTMGSGDVIQLEDLPSQVVRQDLALQFEGASSDELERSLPERVRAFEMALIRDALDRAQGNQSQAARILGLPRRTLAHKAQAYGLTEA